MTLFSGSLHGSLQENWPIDFFASIFTLGMYAIGYLNSWNERIDFCNKI